MTEQQAIDFKRIEQAIEYLTQNFKLQPSLDQVAAEVHMSPFHLQRLFSDWAGVSPKKFLQYLSLQHAKKILHKQNSTLAQATYETGFSGTSRLHDLFVSIEGMTPGEFKRGGKSLSIHYSTLSTPLGTVFIASTEKGICRMAFTYNWEDELQALRAEFPNAALISEATDSHERVKAIFEVKNNPETIKLHLKGTAFQLKVWESLLKIPMGGLANYQTIAEELSQPSASRAVGSAVGKNPVAFIVPCHRVIRSTGVLGEYRWGSTRKAAIIGWEMAKTEA